MFNQVLRRVCALLLIVSVSGVLPLGVNVEVVSAAPPTNDNIADAVDLSALGSERTWSGSNEESTLEFGEDTIVPLETYGFWREWSHSVWFKITPTQGMVEVNTFGSDIDTIVAAFTFATPNNFGSPTLLVLNDDISISGGESNRESKAAFWADGTQTYYIAVGGYGEALTSTGDITLNWSFPPASTNDDIAQAIPLVNTGETRRNHNNFLSTTESGEAEMFGLFGIQDWTDSVWFSVQPAAGSWGIRVENSTGIRIVVLRDDDFYEGDFVIQTMHETGFEATGNTTYYIGIGGAQFEQSFDIIFSPIIKPGAVTSAEYNIGANTTISWPTPANFDPHIHSFTVWMFNGDLVRHCSTTLVASCTFSRLQNGTWTISIYASETLHRFDGDSYTQQLDLTNISNDYFAEPTALTADSGELNDFFDNATLETGEPTHFSSPTTASLWYSYTPTVSGTSTFNVTTTDLDRSGDLQPVVAVYSGSTLSNLQPVASAGTSLTWQSVGGQRYFVAVASQIERLAFSENNAHLYHSMTWSHLPTPATVVETPTTTPVTTPVAKPKITSVKVKNRATMASVLKKAKIKTPRNSRVTYKIAKSSKKTCSISSNRIRFTKKGTCSMTVKVKPKKGATKSYQLSLKY